MDKIRFINRARNKVQFFSKDLANNAMWKKNTGWEPDFSTKAQMPEPINAPSPPDELHAAPLKPKGKGGRPKKNQQPA